MALYGAPWRVDRDHDARTLGVVGGAVGLGARCAEGRASVQLPATTSRMPSLAFRRGSPAEQGDPELAIRYSDSVMAQVQQSVACNALHTL